MVNCHIKKYLIIFFVLVQGAVAFSCASDDEVLEVVDLSVNKEVVDFKSEAGTQNITVSTNAPTWEAKADKNWCTLSVAGKILKVSVDESEERLVREATITITAEGQKKMVKVRQLGYEAANPYGDGRACERIIRKILHENGYDIKILSEFSPN